MVLWIDRYLLRYYVLGAQEAKQVRAKLFLETSRYVLL